MSTDMKNKPEEYWKEKLTPEQYHSLREKGTEAPGSGELLQNEETGDYTCAACGSVLFKSDTKYESTIPGLIGWPSFSDVASSDAVESIEDNSLGMARVEIICKTCGGHLGHLFPDSTSPTNQHYCINSSSLNFKPQK
mgnify:FL=1